MRAAFWYVSQIMRIAPPTGGIAIETFPGPGTTADIDVNYFIAHNAATEFHPTGTCSMMPMALGVWWIRGWWCMGQRMCALWTGR
jgi:hypothetical protein